MTFPIYCYLWEVILRQIGFAIISLKFHSEKKKELNEAINTTAKAIKIKTSGIKRNFRLQDVFVEDFINV